MATDEPTFRQHTRLASGVPLGGLGTGSVELMDTGRFHDWEIFNNYQWSGNRDETAPEMWTEDAFFALRVREPDRTPRVRLLHLEDDPTKTVSPSHDQAYIYNYPFLRNVAAITYAGRYPFARLSYEDDTLPVEVEMEAFAPFIPHNAKDSGLPLAFFVFTVRNIGDAPCDTSLMFSLRNCTGYDRDEITLEHHVAECDAARLVTMGARDLDPTHRTAGNTAIGILGDGASHVAAWTAGRGLEGFEHTAAPAFSQVFYPFRDGGELPGGLEEWSRTIRRRRPEVEPGTLHAPEHRVGWSWRGALARRLRLQPGETQQVVFLMAWFYPNHYHFRHRDIRLGHMYENWFSSAEEVARYGLEHFERLERESRRFADALYEGTLPEWLAASLNAQLTTFPKSFLWTADGEMAVWEGQSCCQIIGGACTIWSSWVPLMFFPEVYTSMVRRMAAFPMDAEEEAEGSPLLRARRRTNRERSKERTDRFGGWLEGRYRDLGYTREDLVRSVGGSRRTALWSGAVELLRDYQWTGERALLDEVWPLVRDRLNAQIEADENGDGLPDGALSFITYDHWFLPATNCYKCSLWLGELQAGARLAELAGDGEAAGRFRAVFERGRATFEDLFWNGEYYSLCYDPKLDSTDRGCMADQVSGQLFARVLGLGTVHDQERVRSALRAVHRHNLFEEEGLLNGVDPDGREDWRYFCRYSGRGEDEAYGGQWPTPWTGTEYYVAAAMAAEGLCAEALDVARNVYDRHVRAGMVYNHIECGEHYFRPLAAWAMLPALQGLTYDRAAGELTFAPGLDPGASNTAFLLPSAWGRLVQERTEDGQANTIRVRAGELPVSRLVLSVTAAISSSEVELNGRELAPEIAVADGQVEVAFSDSVDLTEGDVLEVRLKV